MAFETITATSLQLWISAFIFLILDLLMLWFLTRRVDKVQFQRLKWPLVVVAILFWSAFAFFLVQTFWDSYYQYFYQGWFRGIGILISTPILYGTSALVFHWLALRIRGNPISNFLLLGGIGSILEHLWGIFGKRILEVRMLQETATIDILIVAVPEYIFYWCLVIWIALVVQSVCTWLKIKRQV